MDCPTIAMSSPGMTRLGNNNDLHGKLTIRHTGAQDETSMHVSCAIAFVGNHPGK